MRTAVIDSSSSNASDGPIEARASLDEVVARLESGSFVTSRAVVMVAPLTNRRAGEFGRQYLDHLGMPHDAKWYGTEGLAYIRCTGPLPRGGMVFGNELRANGADQAERTRGVAYVIDVRDGIFTKGKGSLNVGVVDRTDGVRSLTVRADLGEVAHNARLDIRVVRQALEFAELGEVDNVIFECVDAQLAEVLVASGFAELDGVFIASTEAVKPEGLDETKIEIVAPAASIASVDGDGIEPRIKADVQLVRGPSGRIYPFVRPGSPRHGVLLAPEVATHYDPEDLEVETPFGE